MLNRHGAREMAVMTVTAAAIAVPAVALGHPLLAVAAGLALVAGLAFFRDPPRRLPDGLAPGDLISPADGVIHAVERMSAHPALPPELGGDVLVIRVFLSVLNVHVNRSPADGTVRSVTPREGAYLDARKPEAARRNASVLTVLDLGASAPHPGRPVGIRQITGLVARRIVCPLEPGDALARGERFGLIKFGSSTELIVPLELAPEARVEVGDRVRAGRTVLATIGG